MNFQAGAEETEKPKRQHTYRPKINLERTSRLSLIVLAAVALFASLRLAGEVFAPLTMALVLGVVLSPVSRGIEKVGGGKFMAALGVVLVAIAALASLLLFLGPYVSRLWFEAPEILRELRYSFLEVQQLIQGLSDASEEVAKAIDPDAAANGAAAAEEEAPAVPSITDALLAAPAFAAQMMVFLGTLFFFALARDEVYNWLSATLAGPDSMIAARLQEADRLVSRYFLTITVINMCFGACVAAALWLFGMPSPILWGVIAALFNFILYLGPALVAGALLVAGVVVYDGFNQFLPPLIYVTLNLLEGQFVTPLTVGRHVQVNPLLVFLSLVFWLWLWGPVGGIVAIPVVIWCLALTGQLGELKAYPALSRRAIEHAAAQSADA